MFESFEDWAAHEAIFDPYWNDPEWYGFFADADDMSDDAPF